MPSSSVRGVFLLLFLAVQPSESQLTLPPSLTSWSSPLDARSSGKFPSNGLTMNQNLIQDLNSLSPCQKGCSKGLMDALGHFLKSSVSHTRRYELVCGSFNESWSCIEKEKKCGNEDQSMFETMTSGLKYMCVDQKEAFTRNIKCIDENSKDVEMACEEKCKTKRRIQTLIDNSSLKQQFMNSILNGPMVTTPAPLPIGSLLPMLNMEEMKRTTSEMCDIGECVLICVKQAFNKKCGKGGDHLAEVFIRPISSFQEQLGAFGPFFSFLMPEQCNYLTSGADLERIRGATQVTEVPTAGNAAKPGQLTSALAAKPFSIPTIPLPASPLGAVPVGPGMSNANGKLRSGVTFNGKPLAGDGPIFGSNSTLSAGGSSPNGTSTLSRGNMTATAAGISGKIANSTVLTGGVLHITAGPLLKSNSSAPSSENVGGRSKSTVLAGGVAQTMASTISGGPRGKTAADPRARLTSITASNTLGSSGGRTVPVIPAGGGGGTAILTGGLLQEGKITATTGSGRVMPTTSSPATVSSTVVAGGLILMINSSSTGRVAPTTVEPRLKLASTRISTGRVAPTPATSPNGRESPTTAGGNVTPSVVAGGVAPTTASTSNRRQAATTASPRARPISPSNVPPRSPGGPQKPTTSPAGGMTAAKLGGRPAPTAASLKMTPTPSDNSSANPGVPILVAGGVAAARVPTSSKPISAPRSEGRTPPTAKRMVLTTAGTAPRRIAPTTAPGRVIPTRTPPNFGQTPLPGQMNGERVAPTVAAGGMAATTIRTILEKMTTVQQRAAATIPPHRCI